MAMTLHERWSPETQGYSSRTLPTRSLKNAPPKTSLCLGSGLQWDPAEAARVAAEERQRANSEKPSRKSSPSRKKKAAFDFMIRPDSATRHVESSGWLSASARANQKDTSMAPPPPSPPPLQGPLDPRVMAKTFRSLEKDDDPADDASKVRKGGGKVGGRSEIPPRVRQMLRDRWRTTVEAKTGLKSYDALREAVRELRE